MNTQITREELIELYNTNPEAAEKAERTLSHRADTPPELLDTIYDANKHTETYDNILTIMDLAGNASVSSNTLKRIYDQFIDENAYKRNHRADVMSELSRNPTTTPAMLESIFHAFKHNSNYNKEIGERIVKNPSATAELLEAIYDTYKESLTRRKKDPQQTNLTAIALGTPTHRETAFTVIGHLSGNPKLPQPILEQILKRANRGTKSRKPDFDFGLARNPNTPTDTLERIYRFYVPAVYRFDSFRQYQLIAGFLAANPSFPLELMNELLDTASQHREGIAAVEAVLQNPNAPITVFERAFKHYKDRDELNARAFLKHLSENPRTPAHIVEAIQTA